MRYCLEYIVEGQHLNSPCYFVPGNKTATIYVAGFVDTFVRKADGKVLYDVAVIGIDPQTGAKTNFGRGLTLSANQRIDDATLEITIGLATKNSN